MRVVNRIRHRVYPGGKRPLHYLWLTLSSVGSWIQFYPSVPLTAQREGVGFYVGRRLRMGGKRLNQQLSDIDGKWVRDTEAMQTIKLKSTRCVVQRPVDHRGEPGGGNF